MVEDKNVRVEMTEEASDTVEPETVISQETPYDHGAEDCGAEITVASRKSTGAKTETTGRKFIYEVPQGATARIHVRCC